MKLKWHKPEVTEQEVGLEVTSYAPAELDRSLIAPIFVSLARRPQQRPPLSFSGWPLGSRLPR